MTDRRLQQLGLFLGAFVFTVIFAVWGKVAMAAIALLVFWVVLVAMIACTVLFFFFFFKDIGFKECDSLQDIVTKLTNAFRTKTCNKEEIDCPYEVDAAPSQDAQKEESEVPEEKPTEEAEVAEEEHIPVPYENNP